LDTKYTHRFSSPDSEQQAQVGSGKKVIQVADMVSGYLLCDLAAALILTTFIFFQSYEVEGRSIRTTLQNQDRLIVEITRTLAK